MNRQAEYRQRMKDKGLTQVNVWIDREHRDAVQEYARALRDGGGQLPPAGGAHNAVALIDNLNAEFSDTRDAELTKMSKTAGKQTMRVIDRLTELLTRLGLEVMRKHIHDNLGADIEKQRDRIRKLGIEAAKEREELKKLRLKVNGIMSKDEYRQVLGCLHPDRAPDGQQSKYGKAFEIFKRLSKSVVWSV